MPDDDRISRDHGPGWKRVVDLLSTRKPALRAEDPPPEHSHNAEQVDRAIESSLRTTLERLHPQPQPQDFRGAADAARRTARQVLRHNDDELCTSSSGSSASVLLHQAARVVVTQDGPEATLARSNDDLAAAIAREFLRGMGRRYGLDRIAMQESDPASESALDLLTGFDMFLAGPLIGGLVQTLLDDSGAEAAPTRWKVA